MGSNRSGHLRCPDSLPAMQLFEHRISADDPEVFDARARCCALRDQNNSEGILLPGLSFYLDEPGTTRDRAALASILPRERGRTGLIRLHNTSAAAEISLPTMRAFSATTLIICCNNAFVLRLEGDDPRCFTSLNSPPDESRRGGRDNVRMRP
jgi:hypothetical protein